MMEWRLANLQGEYKTKTGKTLTIRKIAADTGLSKSAINDITTGKTQRPDEKTIVALLSYFSRLLDKKLITDDMWHYVPEVDAVIENEDGSLTLIEMKTTSNKKKNPSSNSPVVNDIGIAAAQDPGEPKNSL